MQRTILTPSAVIPGLLNPIDPPVGDLTTYDLQAQSILSEFQGLIETAALAMGKYAVTKEGGGKSEEDVTKAFKSAMGQTKFRWHAPEEIN